jgi:hypothetical protein
MEDYDNRPKRPSRTQSAVVIDEEKDETKTDLSKEKLLFIALIIAWEILIVILYAVWVVYVEDETLAEWYTVEYYDYFRFPVSLSLIRILFLSLAFPYFLFLASLTLTLGM